MPTLKRYGLIVAKEGEEIFFHQRQIIADDKGDVHEGQIARFHIHRSAKEPEAVNVELINE